MVRKMPVIGFSYLAGLLIAPFFSYWELLIIGIMLLLLSFIMIPMLKSSSKFFTVFIAMFFAAALLVYGLYERHIYAPFLNYDGTEQDVEGRIVDINYLDKDMATYTIRTTIEGKEVKINLFAADVGATYYDTIITEAKLRVPVDTQDFAQKSYYKSQGIFLVASSWGDVEIVPNNDRELIYHIRKYSDYINTGISRILPGDEGAMLRAMLTGDKSGLDTSMKNNLYRAGVGHIIAVSGLHLSIVIGFIMAILSLLKLNRYIKTAFIVVACLVFVVFSGMSVSVIRSMIMITIFYLSRLFNRKSDTLSSLSIAVFALVLVNPFAGRDIGLLLSASGTFGIAVVGGSLNRYLSISHPLRGMLGHFRRLIVPTICASACTIPVAMLVSDEVSIISPIVNVFVVPLCTLPLICAVLFALTGGIRIIGIPLLWVAKVCLKALLKIADIVAGWQFSYISLSAGYIYIWAMIAIVGIVICKIIFDNWVSIGKTIAMCFIILLIGAVSYKLINKDNLTVTVLSDSKTGAVIMHDNYTCNVFVLGKSKKLGEPIAEYMEINNIDSIGILSMPLLDAGDIAAYRQLERFNIKSIVMRQELIKIMESDRIFEDSKKYIANDMEINGDSGYNISMNATDGQITSLELYSDDFKMLCINAKDYDEFSDNIYDIIVCQNSINDEVTISNSRYALLLDDSQATSSISTAEVVHIYTSPRTCFIIGKNGEVVRRRMGYALY